MPQTLKSLEIHKARNYEPNTGKYVGEIEYEGEDGSIKMVLSPKVSEAILVCIGSTITEFAAQVANEVKNNLIASVEEAKQAPAIEG